MNIRRQTVTTACAALFLATPAAIADIPPHPDEIEFPPLEFDPPDAADYRHTLETSAGSVPVYLAPSHEFPLISVVFTFKGGDDLDPPDRIGLAGAMAAMMRRGGTTTVPAEQMDEELDFLAAVAGASARGVTTTASLNSLAANFDESFALFMDMLRRPGWDRQRLEIYKEEQLERMKQRNDRPGSILSREWGFLVYGPDHFEGAMATASSIGSIRERDLAWMHGRIIHPGNLIIAATGDFEPDEMLRTLEQALAGWAPGEPVPDPPSPRATLAPGLYHVEMDLPQGRVNIGIRGIERDDPDYFPMVVMNRILGGGGFTSRIVSRVRSDEGLAYNAGSRMVPRVHYPGEFRATFQSKNRTVALAAKLILEEIETIRNEPVTVDELATARAALIETFPQRFESKDGMLRVFVNDEMTDRDPDYWKQYRDMVKAVTAEDVTRVARKYLRPDEMAILVVGPWEEIAPGDLDGRASMSELGTVTHLPMRDPLTLETQ